MDLRQQWLLDVSVDVNRCYLREEEDDASRLRRCGDAFVDSSLCRRCGCCYDPSVRPHCYIPVGR